LGAVGFSSVIFANNDSYPERVAIMRRVVTYSFVLVSALTLGANGGCRMCASPFDYCGPVVDCDNDSYQHASSHGGAGGDGAYYENGSAPEEISRPQPPHNMRVPSPSPTGTPQAQKSNPYMRSSRY
jgi:hypothetical protein